MEQNHILQSTIDLLQAENALLRSNNSHGHRRAESHISGLDRDEFDEFRNGIDTGDGGDAGDIGDDVGGDVGDDDVGDIGDGGDGGAEGEHEREDSPFDSPRDFF